VATNNNCTTTIDNIVCDWYFWYSCAAK
jgi:hypothetical protein